MQTKLPNFKPSFQQAAADAHDWLRELGVDFNAATIESELRYITNDSIELLDRAIFGLYMCNATDSKDDNEYKIGLERLKLDPVPISRKARRFDSIRKRIEGWFNWADIEFFE